MQFTGKLVELDSNGKETSSQKVELNTYKYNPSKDPMNLRSIFFKFPQEDIQKNMESVTNFPLKGGDKYPDRLFIHFIGISSRFDVPNDISLINKQKDLRSIQRTIVLLVTNRNDMSSCLKTRMALPIGTRI